MSCKICKHRSRRQIERLLELGRSPRELSEIFPDISYRTFYRHKDNCMTEEKRNAPNPYDDDENGLSSQNSSIVGVPPARIDTIFTATEICDNLRDIDADAKLLFNQEIKAGNLNGANEKLMTRLAVQNMVVEIAQMATFTPKNSGPGDEEEIPEKPVETIPPELQEIVD